MYLGSLATSNCLKVPACAVRLACPQGILQGLIVPTGINRASYLGAACCNAANAKSGIERQLTWIVERHVATLELTIPILTLHQQGSGIREDVDLFSIGFLRLLVGWR